MPKSLVSTLMRGAISNMITGCQGVPGRPYPFAAEVKAVAKHLCEVYTCFGTIET